MSGARCVTMFLRILPWLFGEFNILPKSLFIVYERSNLSANFLVTVLVCLFEHGLENSILFLPCSGSVCGCDWQSQASHWPLLSSTGASLIQHDPTQSVCGGLGFNLFRVVIRRSPAERHWGSVCMCEMGPLGLLWSHGLCQSSALNGLSHDLNGDRQWWCMCVFVYVFSGFIFCDNMCVCESLKNTMYILVCELSADVQKFTMCRWVIKW